MSNSAHQKRTVQVLRRDSHRGLDQMKLSWLGITARAYNVLGAWSVQRALNRLKTQMVLTRASLLSLNIFFVKATTNLTSPQASTLFKTKFTPSKTPIPLSSKWLNFHRLSSINFPLLRVLLHHRTPKMLWWHKCFSRETWFFSSYWKGLPWILRGALISMAGWITSSPQRKAQTFGCDFISDGASLTQLKSAQWVIIIAAPIQQLSRNNATCQFGDCPPEEHTVS